MDSSSVLGAAFELFRARHFPGVVAACADALIELAPGDASAGPIHLLAARSLLALRREAEAQHEIRACLRIDPQCAAAYRLLGELAARADQLASAKIFLREAIRLAPDDLEAHEWLALVEKMARPTAAAANNPAAKAAVGRSLPAPRAVAPAQRAAASMEAAGTRQPAPAVRAGASMEAAGSRRTVATVPRPGAPAERSAPVGPVVPDPAQRRPSAFRLAPLPLPAPSKVTPLPRARGTSPPPSRAPSTGAGLEPESSGRMPAAGFGQYLVDCGLLTAMQLKAALVYKRSTGVRLGAAAVALGLVSEPKIEWASLAYHGRPRSVG